jgi:hypothetical protein
MDQPRHLRGQLPGGLAAAREFIVPAIMAAVVAAYAVNASGLSFEALLFPMGLGAVLVTAVTVTLAGLMLGRCAAAGEDEGAMLQLRPWIILILPLLLLPAITIAGTAAVLFLSVLGAQFALGSKSLLRSTIVALAVTVPTYFLFKHMLYVRFPAGVLGLG